VIALASKKSGKSFRVLEPILRAIPPAPSVSKTSLRDVLKALAVALLAAAPLVVYHVATGVLATQGSREQAVETTKVRAKLLESHLQQIVSSLSSIAFDVSRRATVLDYLRAELSSQNDPGQHLKFDEELRKLSAIEKQHCVVRLVGPTGTILGSTLPSGEYGTSLPGFDPKLDLTDGSAPRIRAGLVVNGEEIIQIASVVPINMPGDSHAAIVLRAPRKNLEQSTHDWITEHAPGNRVLGVDAGGNCVLDSGLALMGERFARPTQEEAERWRKTGALGISTDEILNHLPAGAPLSAAIARVAHSESVVACGDVRPLQWSIAVFASRSAVAQGSPLGDWPVAILTLLGGGAAFAFAWTHRRRADSVVHPSLVGPILAGLGVLAVGAGATLYASRSVLERGRDVVHYFAQRIDGALRGEVDQYIEERVGYLNAIDDDVRAGADIRNAFMRYADEANRKYPGGWMTLHFTQEDGTPGTPIVHPQASFEAVLGEAKLPKGSVILQTPSVTLDFSSQSGDPRLVLDAPFMRHEGLARIVWAFDLSVLGQDLFSEVRTGGFEVALVESSTGKGMRVLYPFGRSLDPDAISGSRFRIPRQGNREVRLVFRHVHDIFGTAASRTYIVLGGLLISIVSSIGTTLLLSSLINYRRASRIDALTGLRNRPEFVFMLDRELQRAARYKRPLSVALVDVDFFKRINDTLGHAAGDDVLCAVGRTLEASVRTSDFVFRVGGEEFAILLAETDARAAMHVMQRVRERFASAPLEGAAHAGIITVSAGVATLLEHETPDEILQRADAALYEAKRSGRNRVLAAGPRIPLGSPQAQLQLAR